MIKRFYNNFGSVLLDENNLNDYFGKDEVVSEEKFFQVPYAVQMKIICWTGKVCNEMNQGSHYVEFCRINDFEIRLVYKIGNQDNPEIYSLQEYNKLL